MWAEWNEKFEEAQRKAMQMPLVAAEEEAEAEFDRWMHGLHWATLIRLVERAQFRQSLKTGEHLINVLALI